MKFNYYYFVVCFSLFFLISDGLGAKWDKDGEEGLITNLELDEYDFEDVCSQSVVQYEWNAILSNGNNDKNVVENFAKNQKEKADRWIGEGHTIDEYPPRTELVARKLELISRSGDVVLPQEKYSELLEFQSAISKAIVNRRNECDKMPGKKCELTLRDPKQLLVSWRKLDLFNSTSDISNQYPDMLQLLSDAATANGFPDVKSYWLMLSELNDDGYIRAEELWSEVRPFYQKLHDWVAKNLRIKFGSFYFEDHDNSAANPSSIPSHLLGSRLGMDWTYIADLVMSKECQKVPNAIQSMLKEKKIAGKELYLMTEMMTSILNIGKLPQSFWKYSLFNQSCPSRAIDPCKDNFRVAACNEPSWSEYLNAHEIAMQSVHSDLSDSLSYLLKNGNRYSALDQAIAGMASIIASNRHYLVQQNLLKLPENNCVKDALLILIALREIPKIPYYLVADMARLQAIDRNETENIASIWRQLRMDENMQGLLAPETDWWGFLEDHHIAANKPYISHFYGSFIKFQLFEEMLMRDEAVSPDNAKFIDAKDEFRTLLRLGRSKRWPSLLDDTFNMKSVSSAPLLRFFSRLDILISPGSKSVETPKAIAPTTLPSVNRIIPVETTDILTEPATTKQPPPSKITEDAGGLGIGTILFTMCAIMMAVALIVAIVKYSKKRFAKNRQYERPPNQPV